MQFKFTRDGMKQLAITGGATLFDLLNAATVKLYSNNITPGWTSVLGDFTEATYTGYTPILLATRLTTPASDDINQEWFVKMPMAPFGKCTAVPETEYGVFVVDSATSLILYGAALFDAPQSVGVGFNLYVNLLMGIGQGTQQSSVELDNFG